MTNDDRDLRVMFAALRREDQRSTPPFQSFWKARARRAAVAHSRRSIGTRWIGAIAAGAAIVMTALMLQRGKEPNIAVSEWKAPTDFLLQVPGRDLLTTVPRFGVPATADAIKEPLP